MLWWTKQSNFFAQAKYQISCIQQFKRNTIFVCPNVACMHCAHTEAYAPWCFQFFSHLQAPSDHLDSFRHIKAIKMLYCVITKLQGAHCHTVDDEFSCTITSMVPLHSKQTRKIIWDMYVFLLSFMWYMNHAVYSTQNTWQCSLHARRPIKTCMFVRGSPHTSQNSHLYTLSFTLATSPWAE